MGLIREVQALDYHLTRVQEERKRKEEIKQKEKNLKDDVKRLSDAYIEANYNRYNSYNNIVINQFDMKKDIESELLNKYDDVNDYLLSDYIDEVFNKEFKKGINNLKLKTKIENEEKNELLYNLIYNSINNSTDDILTIFSALEDAQMYESAKKILINNGYIITLDEYISIINRIKKLYNNKIVAEKEQQKIQKKQKNNIYKSVANQIPTSWKVYGTIKLLKKILK